ncbi:hypothetical protein [Nitrosomonas sp. Nm34]|uniref:hypothetical protein n=1 Tax=Nitrosomonas sp. Nm34 TaxID=1881055 RepID=UPI0008E4EDF0|nr:hypothetical protein [Nitrosomonas sp. Nm34]SFI31554.1 hypothetical protein SAMN05428978_100579 [Nitrosomonas sp. Nm34]
MNKNLKDILTHSGVALAMVIILLLLPHSIAVTIAVVASWYMWELGQRVAMDQERRGAECMLYWFDIRNWSNQARLEFLVPSIVAIVAVNIYVIITL